MIARAIESGRAEVLRGTVARGSLTPFASILDAPFVGSDFSVLPATSAFGLLARMVRLNAFEPTDLFRLFGIRARRADDLSELMTFSQARHTALARALRLSSVPPTWNLTVWFPFQSSSEILRPEWAFRYCPQCIRSGYHTLLHQLPWINRCPWHGATLINACPCCGSKPPVLADWRFDRNLTCNCGHALLSTNAALKQSVGPPSGAADFIAGYLEWAAIERERVTLVAPEHPTNIASALGDLIPLPRNWARRYGERDSRRHTRVWRAADHAPHPDRKAIKQFDTLRQDRPGFLVVPDQTRGSIAHVAADLALKLPSSSLTEREMNLFLAGIGMGTPKAFQPAQRRFSTTLSTLPPWVVAGQQFLNLACLHPMAYRPIVKLVDIIAPDDRSSFNFHAQATISELNLLIRACGHLLARGYAEGLRAILSRYIPDLYKMRRDAPHLTTPWILVTRDQTRLFSIRVVWIPMDCTQTAAADLLEEAEVANQRRERRHGKSRERLVHNGA